MKKGTPINNLEELLKENSKKLLLAFGYLEESYRDCLSIDPSYSNNKEELIYLEALTSRFERFVDIMLSKYIKSVVLYEGGPSDGTTKDMLLYLEKMKLISNAYHWVEMKNLRNMIAHDYLYQENRMMKEAVETYIKQDIIPFIKKIKK
ncbi:MAG TPA: hypothetical protein PLW93_03015 [Candidatus Absconditabacterales bacterium]|nr:hypothetical protein [Candidatus Absconditabacterales bacterium]HNG97221.1 hypothetical protein [Candidatus Absconditabacterales bacterium]